MGREEVFARFRELLANVLNLEPAEVELADLSTAGDFEEWDSLAHVRVMLEVERVFSIRFTTAQLNSPENVGQLIDLIAEKTGP